MSRKPPSIGRLSAAPIRVRPTGSIRGSQGVLPTDQLERYCEVIAALKLRSTNKKGRHLSTTEAIRLLETYGVETPDGFVQAPKDVLKKPTVNRYLSSWGLDWRRLRREPPSRSF